MSLEQVMAFTITDEAQGAGSLSEYRCGLEHIKAALMEQHVAATDRRVRMSASKPIPGRG